eukprot:4557335-Prymnesium_polylepis.1
MRHARQDDLQRAARLDGHQDPVRVVGAHAAPTRPVAEEEQRRCRWEDIGGRGGYCPPLIRHSL